MFFSQFLWVTKYKKIHNLTNTKFVAVYSNTSSDSFLQFITLQWNINLNDSIFTFI